ncbi:MAG: hypothetical protein GX555_13295 [Actinomycetales bacterium]|nr:hypothetical protein [Actinomycetales bacterium]
MGESLRSRVIRKVPVVGWRTELLAKRARQVVTLRETLEAKDAQIARLRAQVDREKAARKRAQERLATDRPETMDSAPASFRRNLIELRRNLEALRPLDPDVYHPLLQIPRKLRNYRLAASHGIAVPEVLGVWATQGDIDLSAMPDQFVLKSDLGAGGHGVFPLRRVGPDRFELIGGEESFTTEDLRERYRAKRSTRGPFFAEAFLTQRVVAEEIPDDVKIYACYGEVAMVLLRQMPEHANLDRARYRYTDGLGRDLGTDVVHGGRIDPSIPLPEPFADFISLAEHMSRAVALPFVRVDIYDTVDGPVLGELTRGPGGQQRYRRDQDIAMGRAWDEAKWRLDLDVIAGRPLRNLHGLHPAPNYYPENHPSQQEDPRGWEVITADCAQWCLPHSS